VLDWTCGNVVEFLVRGVSNRSKNKLPLALGSGSEVHHHDRLTDIILSIRRTATQRGDPGPRECIPIRSAQLIPSLVKWHEEPRRQTGA
jgi:hypothetical protein